MADKRQAKKDALKGRLLEAAREVIANDGLGALRARDLAEKAGCATGSVYNIFADLDDLILHANAQTMMELRQALSVSTQGHDPAQKLEALALAYARFARQHRKLWEALFQHRMADGSPSPDWFLQGHRSLLEFIARPLAELQPSRTDAEHEMRARTYFAAVHGIVSISLEERFLGLPSDNLTVELSAFVAQLVSSMTSPSRAGQ